MKVECENLSERGATSELVRELIRDDARRGEFMILMQDADEEAFVQIAGDYEDVGERNDGCFDLEYRDGASSLLYHANRRATADEVEQAFLSELRGERPYAISLLFANHAEDERRPQALVVVSATAEIGVVLSAVVGIVRQRRM